VADTVARLDLRDPENRRAAEALLRRPLPWRTAVAHEVRGVMRLAVERGTVERSVYEVRDETGRLEIAAKLGAELGVDASKVRVWRTLVSAGARTGGSGERAREDCVQGPR
jgi:hypothetical protein